MQLLQFPVCGRQVRPWRSGNDLCDSMRHRVPRRDLQEYDAHKSKWKAIESAYRQWGIADGNDTTPMEVDALMKGKGKNKEKARAKK